MKSCATGLSVRVFRVTTPFGTRAIGRRTGKTLISERMAGNFNAEAGKIVTKRPLASRLIRASGGIGDHSRARIIELRWRERLPLRSTQSRFQAVAAPTIRSTVRQARSCAAEPTDFAHPPRRQTSHQREIRSPVARLRWVRISVRSKDRRYARSVHGAASPRIRSRDEIRCADSAGRADR